MTAWPGIVLVACAAMLIAGAQPVLGDALDAHPNHRELQRILAAPVPGDFKPTGLSRADYLRLIAGNIDFFKRHQNDAGAIIDPVSRGERQYSTPAFAAAAGVLVRDAGRNDLLEPACRAMTCALTALVQKRAADSHADFYIPLLVHARRVLKDVAPADQVRSWDQLFMRIDPETMYRADLRGMNWNIVSSAGELLRRKNGLVAPDRSAAQMEYLEKCLRGHLDRLTPLGLFEDPGAPLAYDAFSRLWLEDVYADGAYAGEHSDRIEAFLRTGGLSTLLLLSPSGEWASGGRSALHNWNEAEIAVICEINAVYWKSHGRPELAGAFKRAARLALQSMTRWQRPSGELWIIKNRAEPDQRLAFEPYSHHSQYNLLPMAMLAMAYERADETIAERPMPSEVGGYVFDARQTFHKIAAAAGWYYVLIDTDADPHYNATGLQRVHRVGVAYPALSDTAAGERSYGPKEPPKLAIATGLQWKNASGEWTGLADCTGQRAAWSIELSDEGQISAKRTQFSMVYRTATPGDEDRSIAETYTLSADGVDVRLSVSGPADAKRVQLPVLVNDGARDTQVALTDNSVSVKIDGSTTTVSVIAGQVTEPPKLEEPRTITHNGYVQRGVAGVRGDSVTLRISLSQE